MIEPKAWDAKHGNGASEPFPCDRRQKYQFGVNWYDALKCDDQFGCQFTASLDLTTVKVHSTINEQGLSN